MHKKEWGKNKVHSSIQQARLSRGHYGHSEVCNVEEGGWAFLRLKKLRLSGFRVLQVLVLIFLVQSFSSQVFSSPLLGIKQERQKELVEDALVHRNIHFNIPQQRADLALTLFAEQANLTLVFPFDDVKEKVANQLVGQYSLQEAATKLLAGTGLFPSFGNQLVLTITTEIMSGDEDMNRKKNILASTIAFFVGVGGVQGLAAEEVTGASSDNRLLEEVVVTASKRGAGTRIQDTAMAISAIGADAIDKRGLVGMADYLPSLPGVSMQDRGATHNSIVMRGISSDPESESQAVGVYFGETPITGLGSAISFAGNADIKMVDIEQVEVLRGPQGTLYGAASMGGAVRVIPMSPKLGEWEGEIAGSYSKTGEGGDDNNMLRSIINIPLVDDSLALRAVVYHFDNSGYIESGSTDGLAALAAPLASGGVPSQRKEIGGDEYTGGRIAGLWQASDALDFTLTYTQQEVEQDGFPEVSLALDDKFQQPRLRTGALGSRDEFLSNEIKITNLLFNYQLDWGSITSSSSWIDYEANISIDLSHVFGIPANADGYNNTESFIEEIRFSSDLNGSIQFLAGFYYEDNKKINPVTIASSGIPPIPFFIDQDAKLNTEQQAVFGELRYTFNEQLEATLGARYFEYEQEDILNATGAFTASGRTLNEDEGDNYKFNLSYTPTEDYLVYFQWAEGFRLGAPQAPLTSACDIDEDGLVDGLNIALKPIEPDELESFEIGVKASFADNRISLNAAVYRINWQGMPVTLSPPCNVNVRINAGESKSEGIELELQASLTERLHLSMSASYGEATLTEDIPLVTGFGSRGDDLPGSADFNLSTSLEYQISIAGRDAYVRGDYAYIGEFYNSFSESGEAAGGYSQLHLKAGVELNQFDINLYINNVTNADDLTWVEQTYSGNGTQRAYRLRPRTIGLNAAYRF